MCHVVLLCCDSCFDMCRSGLSEPVVADVAFGVLRALAHLHECGVTHRNLSSANVLLDPHVCCIFLSSSLHSSQCVGLHRTNICPLFAYEFDRGE